MNPKRIRLSRAKGFRLPANTVNVARPGKWGNPFVVGKDGSQAECVDLHRKMLAGYLCLTSAASIEQQRKARETVLSDIEELRGKDLACWCPLDKPCHAEVLLEIANSPKLSEERHHG